VIFPTREQAIKILVAEARERLRPTLPPCWKCDAKHWPVEPCDDTPVPGFPRILAGEREDS
jgi:hypothetical protein